MNLNKTAEITQDILSEIGLSDFCYQKDADGPILDADGLLQANKDCIIKVTEIPSVLTTNSQVIDVHTTKEIGIVDLLNAMAKMVDVSNIDLSNYVKYDDKVEVKLNQINEEDCDGNYVCSYPDSEIVKTDRVKVGETVKYYWTPSDDGDGKYIEKIVLTRTTDPAPSSATVSDPYSSDPFVRFNTKIFYDLEGKSGINQFSQLQIIGNTTNTDNITSETYLVHDNTSYNFTLVNGSWDDCGSYDDMLGDGDYYDCATIRFTLAA